MADDDVLDVSGNDLRDELREQVKSMVTPQQVDGDDYLAADEFLLMEGGRMAVRLYMVKGQPILGFGDAQGTTRLVIGLGPNGNPIIQLSDAQGCARASIAVTESGPHIALTDQNGKTSEVYPGPAKG